MLDKTEDRVSIVLIGSFNPAIFHPAWFEQQGLLPSIETKSAQIEIISNDIAIFSVGWLRLEVVGERFTAKTNDESKFGPLFDLVTGTFKILEHTPITQLGINRELQFALPTVEKWHTVGHTLAPKKIWEKYTSAPGMKALVMECVRDDKREGALNITVKPTIPDKTSLKPWRVEVAVNDHMVLSPEANSIVCCNVISEDWEKSLDRAITIAKGLISDAQEEL